MGTLERRTFITLAVATATAGPLAAKAHVGVMPIVGFLRSATADSSRRLVAAFVKGLGEAGFTVGRNVGIEFRWGMDHPERLAALAEELVRRQVAVIVTNGRSTPAAKSATASIPIVFVTGNDPVARGNVASLDRPGGNVTGVSFFSGPIGAKRLEYLIELVPSAKTVALLLDPNNPGPEAELHELKAGAQALRRRIIIFEATREQEFKPAFSALSKAGAGAVFVGASAFFFSQRRQMVALAARYRIPTSYLQRGFVDAGGLMSYSASQPDAYRRAGRYVGRILKGEKPGDMPVELPTQFELVINLRTARALGLRVPPKLLSLADDVIE